MCHPAFDMGRCLTWWLGLRSEKALPFALSVLIPAAELFRRLCLVFFFAGCAAMSGFGLSDLQNGTTNHESFNHAEGKFGIPGVQW